MKYDAVIFDLDDTLLRSVGPKWAHHKAVASRHYGLSLTDNDILEYWGKPLDVLVGGLYRQLDTPDNILRALADCEPEFRKGIFDDTMSVVTELLDHGVDVGIVTATLQSFVSLDLLHHQMPVERFAFVQCADDTLFHKPDPRVFEPALRILRERHDNPRVVYVGDALADHDAAVGAGIDFIAVTTGLVDETRFREHGAQLITASLTEVLSALMA